LLNFFQKNQGGLKKNDFPVQGKGMIMQVGKKAGQHKCEKTVTFFQLSERGRKPLADEAGDQLL
jgi:hypothetical protein